MVVMEAVSVSPAIRVFELTNGSRVHGYREVFPMASDLDVTFAWEFQADSSYGPAFSLLDRLMATESQFSAMIPGIDLMPLEVNWSLQNTQLVGNDALGHIGNTHWDADARVLHVLGDVDTDADHWDDHVLIHEWVHYLEDSLGIRNSPGGEHSLNDFVDPRLAFSEGLANGLSGALLNDPAYRDTSGSGGQQVWVNYLENSLHSLRGFGSERSIQEIIYDLCDTDNDDPIDGKMNLVFETLLQMKRDRVPVISIHSFAHVFQSLYPDEPLHSLLNAQKIAGGDIWGSLEEKLPSFYEDPDKFLPVIPELFMRQPLELHFRGKRNYRDHGHLYGQIRLARIRGKGETVEFRFLGQGGHRWK